MSCDVRIARPFHPPASQCPRAMLEVSRRALLCPSAEVSWFWVLWTKCPCGAPSLTSPAPSQLSGFPQTQYCNLFCFFPSSPTTPLRNQLAKSQKIISASRLPASQPWAAVT